MTKLYILILLLFITGCEQDVESARQAKKDARIEWLIEEIYEFTIPNGLECIVLDLRPSTGITCNWQKYNETQKDSFNDQRERLSATPL